MYAKLKSLLNTLGPGLVTGASDNDPAGISTYSVAGAGTGYTFLWLGLLSFPMMVAVQGMVARIGAVSGQGLGQAIKETFGRRWLTVALVALVISNIATIGADLAGIGAGINLLTGMGAHWVIAPVGLFIVLVEVFFSYKMFARYLKYITLVLLSYLAAGFLARPDWGQVLRATFVPHVSLDTRSLEVMVAVLGTTISPYMFFWQASEEVEESSGAGVRPERRRVIDTVVGMFYAVVIFYFIVLASAATLHREHITHIQTAEQAARALRPIAGPYAFVLFSVGLVGAGLLAVPVLAGATAYPIADWLGVPAGLDRNVHRARWFYATITASVAVGVVIALLPVSPMEALFYSQVLMGLLAPLVLCLVILIARNAAAMGADHVNGPFYNVFGWIAVAAMVLADAAMLWMYVSGAA